MRQQQDKENFDTMSVQSESVKSVNTTQPNKLIGCTEETKFILLDLREEADYNQFHIKEAINFPAPNISRDMTFSQLLRFKNLSDKMIVVYMSVERLGTYYAKILFEKGFDNISLLTGGLEKFMEAGLDCYSLVEGTKVPPQPKPAKVARPGSAATSKRSQMGITTTSQASFAMGMSRMSLKSSTSIRSGSLRK